MKQRKIMYTLKKKIIKGNFEQCGSCINLLLLIQLSFKYVKQHYYSAL